MTKRAGEPEKKQLMKRLLLSTCSFSLILGFGLAKAAESNVAPRANEVLSSACKYLAESPSFQITAEIWREHVTDSGQKLQFTRTVKMEVKRPNRLHAEIQSPRVGRQFWYDGHSLSILDQRRNFYSTTPMPETLDAMLDKAHDQFGIDLPLIDLALSDPYQNALSRVQQGRYLGVSDAMGFRCHHLAFTQDNIDWQVWIQDGPQPLIRKFVITHKNEPGAPEFTALIKDWNLTERIAESNFAFTPPTGASKIEMRNDRWAPGTPNKSEPPVPPPSATGR